jgi:chromosome segregation ATPase
MAKKEVMNLEEISKEIQDLKAAISDVTSDIAATQKAVMNLGKPVKQKAVDTTGNEERIKEGERRQKEADKSIHNSTATASDKKRAEKNKD